MEKDEVFAGQKTTRCNVLILSEESKTQWVERREELSLQLPIYVLPNPLKIKPSYRDWVRWLEWIKEYCKKQQIEFVIIDTVSEFWSVNDENKATEVTQALMPLNFLTEDNIAVLLVHHFRKSGGTQGTAARGSGALSSKVDIIVDFTRYEDSEETTKRKLSCLSRFDETPKEIVLDYVNGTYQVLGSSGEVKKQEKLTKMLILFREYTEGFTVTQVFENWDTDEFGKKPTKRTIQRYIASLIDSKQIELIEEKEISGKLGPFYKILSPNHSSQIIDNNLLQKDKSNSPIHDKVINTILVKENVIDANTNNTSPWQQYFPDKPVTEYSDSQLQAAWEIITDYSENIISMFGREEKYADFFEKLETEYKKRGIFDM